MFERQLSRSYVPLLLTIVLLLGLLVARLYNYLLFHSLVELYSAVIACGVFLFAWNSRRFTEDNYLLVVGVAYLFVGGVDVLHTLAFKGMGVFPGYDTNLPTQLWLVARYLEGFSLLAAPLLLNRRRLRAEVVLLVYTALAAGLLAAVFTGIFPVAFIEGQGLTPFKVASEYVVSLALVGSAVLVYRRQAHFEEAIARMLILATLLAVGSELAFTLYNDPYGQFNLIGHLLKVAAFYLLYRAIIQTGLVKPYSLMLRDIKQSNEKLEKMTAQAWDREQEAERRLAELQTLIEAMTEGVLITNAEGRILSVNRVGREILGLSQPEGLVVTQPDSSPLRVLRLDGSPMPKEDEPLSRALRGELVQEEELLLVRGDGQRRWLLTGASPVHDAQGTVRLVVGVFRDITALRQMEEQREEFVRTISHDLRNPLTGLLGHAQILGRRLSQQGLEREASSAEAIVTSGRRMDAMIRDLVDSARLESGTLELRSQPLDLRRLVLDLVERTGTPEDRARIRLESEGEATLVLADPERLERAIANLLSNAFKYSPNDRLVIVRVGRSEGRAVVSVCDQGPGIPTEEQPYLFDRYYRAQTGKTADGLGLGLYIARLIVEAHAGQVWVESEPGQGATFGIALPLVKERAEGSLAR